MRSMDMFNRVLYIACAVFVGLFTIFSLVVLWFDLNSALVVKIYLSMLAILVALVVMLAINYHYVRLKTIADRRDTNGPETT